MFKDLNHTLEARKVTYNYQKEKLKNNPELRIKKNLARRIRRNTNEVDYKILQEEYLKNQNIKKDRK